MLFVSAAAVAVFPGEIRVRVVDVDGRPVPHAEVRWFESGSAPEELAALDRLAAESGAFASADEAGLVSLETSRDVVLVASATGMWGWGSARRDEADVELRVEVDRALVVRVRDDAGRPVEGAPVWLWHSFDGWSGSPEVEWRAETDASGLAVLEHASWIRRERMRGHGEWVDKWSRYFDSGIPDDELTGWAFSLRVDGDVADSWIVHCGRAPGETSTWTDLTAGIASEPVELRIGRARELKLRVDESVFEGATDEVEMDVRCGRFGPDVLAGLDKSSRERVPVVDGLATLRWMQPGARVHASLARNAASDSRTYALEVPDDDEASCELAMPEPMNWSGATLRFFPTVDGCVLRSSPVLVEREFSFGWSDPIEVMTRPSGELVLDVSWQGVRSGRVRCIVPAADGVREAWIDVLDRAIDSGWSEPLEPPRLAFAGAVVDVLGRAVPQATVRVSANRSRELAIEVGADGSFSERSSLALPRTLHASAPGYFDSELSNVPYGSSGVRIVLSRPSQLRGYLMLGAGLSLEQLTIFLLRTDEGTPIETAPGFSRSCSCDGVFDFDRLVPGRYTLLVLRAGDKVTDAPLYRRNDIEVPSGSDVDVGEIRIE